MGLDLLAEEADRDAFFKEAILKGLGARDISEAMERAAEDPKKAAEVLCEEAKRLYEEAMKDVRFYKNLMKAFLACMVVLTIATMVLMLLDLTTAAVGSGITSMASAIVSGVLSKPLESAEGKRDYYLEKMEEWCTKARLLGILAEKAAKEAPSALLCELLTG